MSEKLHQSLKTHETTASMDWGDYYGLRSRERSLSAKIDLWSVVLADRVRELARGGLVLEAGSGTGSTSLIIGPGARRTLVDLEPAAIQEARENFANAGQSADYVVADIFELPFEDEHFDVTFNAGVLEHFCFQDRRRALLEMIRVTKRGGSIVAAVPNHHSIPYRYAYEQRKASSTWPFPDERRIYDFAEELDIAKGVVFVSRETCDLQTGIRFVSEWKTELRFRLMHLARRYEGYLTICTYRKTDGV